MIAGPTIFGPYNNYTTPLRCFFGISKFMFIPLDVWPGSTVKKQDGDLNTRNVPWYARPGQTTNLDMRGYVGYSSGKSVSRGLGK